MSDPGIVLLCTEQWHKSDVLEPFHGVDTICPEAADPGTVRTEPAPCKQLLLLFVQFRKPPALIFILVCLISSRTALMSNYFVY